MAKKQKAVVGTFTVMTLVAMLASPPPTQANAQSCWNWDKMVDGDRYEDEDVFRCLRAGADPTAQDSDGWTPLHYAAHWGHSRTVIALLEAGANPNTQNSDGWSPLHQAALNNASPDVTAALLSAGADPILETTAARMTPVYIARETGKLAIAAMMEAAMNGRMAAGQAQDNVATETAQRNCSTWELMRTVVTMTACANNTGRSGYYEIRHFGDQRARICWTLHYNNGAEARGCRTMDPGEEGRGSCFSCNPANTGVRAITLRSYTPR